MWKEHGEHIKLFLRQSLDEKFGGITDPNA